MPTVLDPAERATLVARLRRVQPTARPRWGTFTAPRMICHLVDALRVGVGELAVQRTDTLPSRTLVKWIVVYSPLQPPPGKVQTAPEMLSTHPTTWGQDMSTVEELIERMAAAP